MNGLSVINSRGRILVAAGSVLAILASTYCLAGWFAPASAPAGWYLLSHDALNNLTVRGRVLAVDDRGATMVGEGARALSVLSPPIDCGTQDRPVICLSASLPALKAGQQVEVPVRFLWQDRPVPEFHFIDHKILFRRELSEWYLSVPPEVFRIHRMGLQFPGLREAITIRFWGLADLPLDKRMEHARRQIATPEPIANHSINFLRGPSIRGHGLNYFLLWLSALALGFYILVQVYRRRRFSGRAIAAVLLTAWFFVDAASTHSLFQQALLEVPVFRGKTQFELMAGSLGGDLAWAYEQILRNVPEGARYAVLSDDTFTPSHRLAYALAPKRTQIDKPAYADFLLVHHFAGAAFDDSKKSLRFESGEEVPAERIAARSPDVLLLRKVSR